MNCIEDRTRSPYLHICPLLLLLLAWGLSLFGSQLGMHPLLCAVLAALLGSAGCIFWGSVALSLFRERPNFVGILLFVIFSALLSLGALLPAFSFFPYAWDTGWLYLLFALIYSLLPIRMMTGELPDRNLFPKLLSASRYPLELADKKGETLIPGNFSTALSSAQRERLLSGGNKSTLSTGPNTLVSCRPMREAFLLVEEDLHDINLLQEDLDYLDSEICKYQGLLSEENTLKKSLTDNREAAEALHIPIQVLQKQLDSAKEAIAQAQKDESSANLRRRLLQLSVFRLTLAKEYGYLLKSARNGLLSSKDYGKALEACLQPLSALGLNSSVRNIAAKDYPAAPLTTAFLAQGELLEDALERHWSDLTVSIHGDEEEKLLRSVFTVTGADSSQISSWVRERNAALLRDGVKAGAGLDAGRCSVYFHVAGGEGHA